MGDREEIADRVISNYRLIELLHEKDNIIYKLEAELSDIKSLISVVKTNDWARKRLFQEIEDE